MDLVYIVWLSSLLALGCADVHAAPAWSDDAGTAHQRVTEPLDLEVMQAWWSTERELSTSVRVLHTGASPIALSAERFEAVSARAVRLAAQPGVFVGACTSDRLAYPDEPAHCVVRFVAESRPVSIAFRTAHGYAEAPIVACSPAERLGVCPFDSTCVDGACERLCNRDRWDGACVNDRQVCDRGLCTDRCDAGEGRGCEEGLCVDGECVDMCPAIAWRDNGCYACAWDVIDAGRCAVEDRCQDCFECPGGIGEDGPRRSCECLHSATCDGCGNEALRGWTCLLEACPSCGD